MTLADDLDASLSFSHGAGRSVMISQDMAREIIYQLRRQEPTPGATRLSVNMNDATRDAQLEGSTDEFLTRAQAALAQNVSPGSSGIFWAAQDLRAALLEAVQRLIRVRKYGLHMAGLHGMSWASMHGRGVLMALGSDPQKLAPASWKWQVDDHEHLVLTHIPSYDKGVRDAAEGQQS